MQKCLPWGGKCLPENYAKKPTFSKGKLLAKDKYICEIRILTCIFEHAHENVYRFLLILKKTITWYGTETIRKKNRK